MDDMPGWFDFSALYDRAVAEAPPGSLLVEVGVYAGKSLCHLAAAAKQAAKGLRVLGVDWCRGDDGVGRQCPSAQAGRVADALDRRGLLDTAALLVADSAFAASLLADSAAYFVFIDADHSQHAVARDLEAWTPKMVPGGLMAGHDYGMPSVGAAVRAFFGSAAVASVDGPNCWEVRL